MDLSQKIKLRREELELSDVEVARVSGLTIDSYSDIESYPDELYEVVPLGTAKRLSAELQFNLLDLLDLPCAFCKLASKFEGDYSLPPNDLIRHQREKHGLSVDELGNRVNYRGIEDKRT